MPHLIDRKQTFLLISLKLTNMKRLYCFLLYFVSHHLKVPSFEVPVLFSSGMSIITLLNLREGFIRLFLFLMMKLSKFDI